MLLNSQRNRLFQILEERGLQPSDFEEGKGNSWYRIRLKEDGNSIYFSVGRGTKDGDEVYQITKRPGKPESPDNEDAISYKVWDSTTLYCCVDEFEAWATAAKLEVHVPDLWSENAKALQLFTSNHSLTTERFSISELGAVQGQLRMLIQNFDVSDLPDNAKVRLTDIARTALLKVETFNKRDWQNWVSGAFANAVVSLGLDETQVKEVLALVRLAFGGLFLQY